METNLSTDTSFEVKEVKFDRKYRRLKRIPQTEMTGMKEEPQVHNKQKGNCQYAPPKNLRADYIPCAARLFYKT